MFTCTLCHGETCIIANHCTKCKKIADLIKVYGLPRVHDLLCDVLVRGEKGIGKKAKAQLLAEKETIEAALDDVDDA